MAWAALGGPGVEGVGDGEGVGGAWGAEGEGEGEEEKEGLDGAVGLHGRCVGWLDEVLLGLVTFVLGVVLLSTRGPETRVL